MHLSEFPVPLAPCFTQLLQAPSGSGLVTGTGIYFALIVPCAWHCTSAGPMPASISYADSPPGPSLMDKPPVPNFLAGPSRYTMGAPTVPSFMTGVPPGPSNMAGPGYRGGGEWGGCCSGAYDRVTPDHVGVEAVKRHASHIHMRNTGPPSVSVLPAKVLNSAR